MVAIATDLTHYKVHGDALGRSDLTLDQCARLS